MPTLPTLTLTDAQATRCLAAWGSTENYRTWLRGQVAGFVIAAERSQAATAYLEAEATRTTEVRTALGVPDSTPAEPVYVPPPDLTLGPTPPTA